jgi:predicted transcriptional regulator
MMGNTGQTKDRFSSKSNLSLLQQTIYILKRLTQTSSLEQIIVAASGNDDEQLIKRFLKFLQDMNWVEKDERQLWVITEKGGIWLKEIEDAMETQRRA